MSIIVSVITIVIIIMHMLRKETWHVTTLDFPSDTYVGFSKIWRPVGGTDGDKTMILMTTPRTVITIVMVTLHGDDDNSKSLWKIVCLIFSCEKKQVKNSRHIKWRYCFSNVLRVFTNYFTNSGQDWTSGKLWHNWDSADACSSNELSQLQRDKVWQKSWFL